MTNKLLLFLIVLFFLLLFCIFFCNCKEEKNNPVINEIVINQGKIKMISETDLTRVKREYRIYTEGNKPVIIYVLDDYSISILSIQGN